MTRVNRMQAKIIRIILPPTGIALSVAAIAWLPLPFIWVALLWCVAAGIAGVLEKVVWLRALWINLGTVALTLGLAEGYFLAITDTPAEELYEGTFTTDYFLAHEILGYAPARNYRATVTKHIGGEFIYDTVYTIDGHGLRIAPPHDPARLDSAVLFFGGSVTFGEGIADDRTMPYRVGMKTGGRFAIYNFGFHGYGPHQMLAALQQGLVEETIRQSPALVIYQAIPAHIVRSAGRVSWDRHGPRYQLDGKGGVYLAGRFDDAGDAGERYRLNHSYLYQHLFGQHRAIRQSELELYLAIVKAARDYVVQHFPRAAFEVILWDVPTAADPDTLYAIRKRLTAAGIPVHMISEILPGSREMPEQYQLNPLDGHPTARAHELIAEYIAKHIIGEATTAAR